MTQISAQSKSISGMGLPFDISRYSLPFIYDLSKHTSLLKSDIYLSKFIETGKRDLNLHEKRLKKKQIIMIKATLSRAQKILDNQDPEIRQDLIFQIIEIMFYYRTTFIDNYKNSRRKRLFIHPFYRRATHPFFLELPYYLDNRDTKRYFAINLISKYGQFLDDRDLLSKIDTSSLNPKDSMFWKNKNIKNEEAYFYKKSHLYKELCNINSLYQYRKAKKTPEEGGGYNYGFKAKLQVNKKLLKVKIKPAMVRHKIDSEVLYYKQEPYYEATGNKIYSLLGYNTDTGFFCPQVRVAFHQKLIDVEVSSRINPKTWDLDAFYKYVILNNGNKLKFREVVTKKVFKYYIDYSVKPFYRNKIKEVILFGAYIEYRKEKTARYAGWDKLLISHRSRREVRAISIIDTWLAAPENFGNNSFKLSLNKKNDEMKFVLTDVGNIFSSHFRKIEEDLGHFPEAIKKALRLEDWDSYEELMEPLRSRSELELEVNSFTFSVFRNKKNEVYPNWNLYGESQKLAQVAHDLQFQNYSFLKKFNPYVKFDDLRFGVRLISKLSERQILHAVLLSGLGYAGARLTVEKLLSRRDQLIKYFGLEHEVNLSRPNGAKETFSWNKDGSINLRNSQGSMETLHLSSFGHYVKDGVFYTSF